MNRHFMIKTKNNSTYCSNCGKRMLQDRYNYQQHAKICDPKGAWYIDGTVTEKLDFGYCLEAKDNALELMIATPVLQRYRWDKEKCTGAVWEEFLRVRYEADCKEIKILKNDTPVPLESWLSLIEAQKYVRIHNRNDSDIIRSVFKIVPDVFSLRIFHHIYLNRGLKYRQLLPENLEKKLLSDTRIPNEEPVHNENTENISASVYKYKNNLILKVILSWSSNNNLVLLFSKDYFASSRPLSMPDLDKFCMRLNEDDYKLSYRSENALQMFTEKYPNFMLQLSHTATIPQVLLGSYYHPGLELLAKSGMCKLVINFHILSQIYTDPSAYHNLNEMFGIPLGMIKKLDSIAYIPYIVDRFIAVYHYNPAFLQFESYSSAQIHFLCSADILRNGTGAPGYLPYYSRLSDNDILKILKYLKNKNLEELEIYRDYLAAYLRLRTFAHGLTPISLPQAHDDILLHFEKKKDTVFEKDFQKQVSCSTYLSLTTTVLEEDKELFSSDPYCIIAPRKIQDLFNESSRMRNCVKLYTERVANGSTRIYFLRKKSAPDLSLGTIEVVESSNSLRLIQAKGFANGYLKLQEQRFIEKWCQAKNITISTNDINLVA